MVIGSGNKDGQGSYVKCRSVDQRELELSAYPSKERVSPVGIGSRMNTGNKKMDSEKPQRGERLWKISQTITQFEEF